MGGRLYLAWKGDGNNNLNVMSSSDFGRTWGPKYTSPETSPQPPALCAHNGNLYIAWKGNGNDHLNVAQANLSAPTSLASRTRSRWAIPARSVRADSLSGLLYLGLEG